MGNFRITNSAISEIVALMGAYRVIILFDKYRCGFPLLLRRRGGRPVDWAMLNKTADKWKPTVVTKNKLPQICNKK
jgi:hypothetical protein